MFEHLFKPGKIGPIELKNRLIMAPVVTNFASMGGEVTQQLIDYYVERTRGGVGLQILEGVYVNEERAVARVSIANDQMVPGLNQLVEAVHECGGVIFVQFNHLGKGKGINKITHEDMDAVLDDYEKAAFRAMKAGFDGIELQAAHGHFVSQFLSPLTNQRNDEYGGSVERRATFARKVIERLKKTVGQKYPVIIRINGDEGVQGGMNIDQSVQISEIMQESGVDAIHVSAGVNESVHWIIQPMSLQKGCLLPLAAKIKGAVHVPVIAVGRINEPALANRAIMDGQADFVAMGRPLVADPWFPAKALEGRAEDIRICTACNYCVGERYIKQLRLKCAINPEVGREREFRIEPAAEKRKVMVVGGGPAGMEAARLLDLRGHRVYLYEKENELGGNARYAYLAPHKEELKHFLDWLILQVERSNITLRLGEAVDEKTIQKIKPDVIVMATGADPIVPDIRGIDSERVMLATDVLSKKKETGGLVAIIGGGHVGCETAEFLAGMGKKVTLIEMLDDFGLGIEPITRSLLLERLSQQGIELLNKRQVSEIQEDKLIVKMPDGSLEQIAAETIVLAAGYTRKRQLFEEIQGAFPKTFLIGDCDKPGQISDAVHAASWVGRQI